MAHEAEAATHEQRVGATNPWLLPGCLMLALTLNILDRQIINVLGNEISRELQLSDSELGLLGGIGFAGVYFLFSFLWGWVSDHPRVSRIHVISAALTIWSSMTALSGVAQNYGHLLAARMGVAAGEAGCSPAAQSIIADTTPNEKLARALSVYALGIPIGAFLGKSLGGLLSDAYGWRAAFFLAGAPGLVLALVLMAMLRDPCRPAPARRDGQRGGFSEAFRQIIRSKTIVYSLLGSTVMVAMVAAGSFWGMMHFQRTLGLSPGTAGVWLGIQGGLSGLIGTLVGGWIADKLAQRRARDYLTPAVIAMLLCPPLLVLAWWTDVWWLALCLLVIPNMLDNVSYGGTTAVTQRLLSPHVRSSANAIMAMFGTLVGAGLGVTALGVASDVLRDHIMPGLTRNESVRLVLIGSSFVFLIPALLFWRARAHAEDELARMEAR